MDDKVQELRRAVFHFLDEHILCKEEDERTKVEKLTVEAGRAFGDALLRYDKDTPSIRDRRSDDQVTSILRDYNEATRREIDIEAIGLFRTPRKS